MLAHGSKRRLVVARGEREPALAALDEDSEPRDLLAPEQDRGRHVIDLIPRDLDVVLGVLLVVELKGLVAEHHRTIGSHAMERRCLLRVIHRAVLRLGHAATSFHLHSEAHAGAVN